MKVFASLYFIFIVPCLLFLGCGETGSVLDVVDDVITEQTNSDIPNWSYYREKNITLNFPEWLKDGSQGQIGLDEAHPHAPDESFILAQWKAVFHEGHIYIPDSSATHVYVFDMSGNMLEDKTMAREVILGGRASPFAPHFGNVSLEGEFLRKTHPDQSVADFVRYMSIEGDILTIEIGWWPGYKNTWITRMGFAESTTTYWNIGTGQISFGRTDKLDCWVEWTDEEGQSWTTTKWCSEVDDFDPNKPYDDYLLFSTETHDYFLDFVHKEGKSIGPTDYSKPYKILTKDGVFVGHFNPDILVHGRDDQWRFRHGIYYGNILYMLAQTVPATDVDTWLNLNPYTFYAFKQN